MCAGEGDACEVLRSGHSKSRSPKETKKILQQQWGGMGHAAFILTCRYWAHASVSSFHEGADEILTDQVMHSGGVLGAVETLRGVTPSMREDGIAPRVILNVLCDVIHPCHARGPAADDEPKIRLRGVPGDLLLRVPAQRLLDWLRGDRSFASILYS